jgi:hypothetical protein
MPNDKTSKAEGKHSQVIYPDGIFFGDRLRFFISALMGVNCRKKAYRGKSLLRAQLQCFLCRSEGIAPSMYYKWSKGFREAGKWQINGDTKREATSDDVAQLRQENEQLNQLVAELSLSNRILKKI